MNVDVATWMLEDRIKMLLDELAPFKTVQLRTKYNKWISQETKLEMAKRDQARCQAKSTDLEGHWMIFKKLRNSVTNLQRKDKKQYLDRVFEKISSEKDTASLFATTRNLLGWKKAGPPTVFNIEGNIIKKQKELADCQLNFYHEKLDKIREKLPKVNSDPFEIAEKKHLIDGNH